MGDKASITVTTTDNRQLVLMTRYIVSIEDAHQRTPHTANQCIVRMLDGTAHTVGSSAAAIVASINTGFAPSTGGGQDDYKVYAEGDD